MTDRAPALEALRAALAGRYVIDRELGAGGMAIVYLARDVARERLVALKVLRPELGQATTAERFQREIRLAARLVHPHVLPILDSGGAGEQLWYTMPYVDGESLRARMDREKMLPLEDAIRLTREVADALGHAHAQEILHRDIKPENILLSGGHALVADFGIARAIGPASEERLTSTGVVLGTPGYMSPEQSTGEGVLDARSDLYALGSVFYEMLVGEPPFTGPTAQVVIGRRLSQPPPSPRATRSQVPEAIDAVVRRALATVPGDRFGSMTEFTAALDAAAARTEAPVHARRVRRAGVGVALLVVAAAGVALIVRGRTAPGSTENPLTASGGIRLAVLPFRLTSNDTADRYLAEGMTEEVTSTLSNLSGLRVIARSSVMPFANTARTMRDIGAALRVNALVSGSVQKVGQAIRVRVQLIDAATEESRWSQAYDHTAQDVFRVQSEVASRVAGVLRIQLAERESRSLARPPTTDPEAYDAFLRARALDTGPTALESKMAGFERAVQRDSSFALAWAHLAATYVATVFNFDADSRRLELADAAIRRALAIDSGVAMAWKARADLEWNAVRGWHFAESLADVRHAIALKPSLSDAHGSLAALYFHYGFMDEAERELRTSLSLDPRDGCDDFTRCAGFSTPRIARVYAYRQQFDSALALYARMSFHGTFLWEEAAVLNAAGRSAEGLALLDTSAATSNSRQERTDRAASHALLYATLGRAQEAEASIRSAVSLREGRSHFHHAQFSIACAYARMGRKAEAVEWLRQTAENGMPNYPLFRNDPNLRSLQGDPGYEALMARLKTQFDGYARLVRDQS